MGNAPADRRLFPQSGVKVPMSYSTKGQRYCCFQAFGSTLKPSSVAGGGITVKESADCLVAVIKNCRFMVISLYYCLCLVLLLFLSFVYLKCPVCNILGMGILSDAQSAHRCGSMVNCISWSGVHRIRNWAETTMHRLVKALHR